MNAIAYTTTDGERWDTIAWRCYADVSLVGEIIAANPTVPITGRLPGGIVLSIPIKDNTTSPVGGGREGALPPWKR